MFYNRPNQKNDKEKAFKLTWKILSHQIYLKEKNKKNLVIQWHQPKLNLRALRLKTFIYYDTMGEYVFQYIYFSGIKWKSIL